MEPIAAVAQPSPREIAARLYREGKLSVEDIAQRVGVSRATVYNWLQAEGLSGSRRGGGRAVEVVTAAEVTAETRWITALQRLDSIANSVVELTRMREINTSQAETIRVDVNEMRRDITDLRTDVARLAGIVEALVAIRGAEVTDP